MLLLLGVALALLAGLPTWISQTYGPDGAQQQLSRTGHQAAPALVALSLVALAGLAASFAVRGWWSRAVGVLVAAIGAGIGAAALTVLFAPPSDATAPDTGLPTTPDLMGPVEVHAWAPVLAAVGGLLVLVSGLLRVLAPAVRTTRPAMGSRYEAPTSRRAAREAAVTDDVRDADAAAGWWKALDAGADPTAGDPADRVDEGGQDRPDTLVNRPDRDAVAHHMPVTPPPDATGPADNPDAAVADPDESGLGVRKDPPGRLR
ncbi:Trp biosynthesis-associated membrane protein [Nakamurella alba]|uniref:Trp biosynthesis-associated membrane protein n=1 Tax=Nakamurella alba TaxID=2665158 RepID=UPI0012B8B4A1|nr:Trp biosynthesis-associated membrane protein [Nakamurella alba]